MRKHEDILFDINNWKNSGVHGTSHELAAIAETLLDIRDLLMNPPARKDWNENKDFWPTPVSEKGGQFPAPCTCGITNGICATKNHHPNGQSY